MVKKMSKDTPVETHYIKSPYLCFKNYYSNVIGYNFSLIGVSENLKEE